MSRTETSQSSIYDEIQEAQAGSRPSTCTMRAILEQLEDADRESLGKALADPNVKGTVIAKVLKSRGHPLSSYTVQRHRRGGCSCDG